MTQANPQGDLHNLAMSNAAPPSPEMEIGEGLSNLDYVYIAFELGKNPLAQQSLNGEIRSTFAMIAPDIASSDAKNVSADLNERRAMQMASQIGGIDHVN